MAERRSATACVLMALLAGCAAGGPLPEDRAPTVPERPAREAPALPGTPGTDITLTASDGTKVAGSVWNPAGQPKAVILALHGFGDYGQLTFRGPGTAWAEAGIATLAPDQRGFGRNPSRARWPGAEALIADAIGYVVEARRRFPCTPIVLLGHSMGGGIALSAAFASRPDALVLAAPAIWGGAALNPFHRLAAWTAANIVPERRFTGRGVVRIIPSDNEDALRAIWADPYYLSPPSAREMFGLVRITDRAAEAASNTDIPALMLLGAKDQIVPERRAREVFDRLTGARKVLHYPEGWHLLFRDLQAETVWADVARFALATPRPKGCP